MLEQPSIKKKKKKWLIYGQAQSGSEGTSKLRVPNIHGFLFLLQGLSPSL